MSDEASGKAYTLEASPGVFTVAGTLGIDLQLFTYPQKLLALAQGLIDSGEFGVSIVVVHMACEVATDRALNDAFKAKGIEYLEEPIERLLPSNNLGNKSVRKIYTALTCDEIQNQPFWQRFTDSVTRRNNISHNGATYGQADAEASLKVAKEFVAHLKK